MPVEAIRVLIKAVRVPIVIVGEPKEAARVYNTLTASTRVSIEALRCFRGREWLEEVPVNVN